MYAKTLSMYSFRCFGKAALSFNHPLRQESLELEMPNVNLILGDNGGGKSSVLRAIAIAALAPALIESGFVAYRLVRRPQGEQALLKLVCDLDPADLINKSHDSNSIELLARIDKRSGSLDRLHLDRTPESPIERLIYDDTSPTFFVVGYGATRRMDTEDYVASSRRKSRGLRYARVASLFEDQVPLRPLQSWLPRIKDKKRKAEAIKKIAGMLPAEVQFTGRFDEREDQYIFEHSSISTPYNSLSDGYKVFVAWCSDLVGHICDIAPGNVRIDQIPGIVLIDEIDMHLHPSWQRTVLPTLSRAFPRLQFIVTSHSPLVASAVRPKNIFLTATAEDGSATIKQIEEKTFGRGADQLLLSSYFGLDTTRAPQLEAASEALFASAAKGDIGSAIAFLEQPSAPASDADELNPKVKRALESVTPRKVSKKSAAKSAVQRKAGRK